MNKSLNLKLILIFIVFIMIVMTTVGIILIFSIYSFYTDDFMNNIENSFTNRLVSQLENNLSRQDFALSQKDLLSAHSGEFGFDSYRNFYILDMEGNVLESSAASTGTVTKTQNLLSAMNRKNNNSQHVGADSFDYALYLKNEQSGNESIIYIVDDLTRMKSLIWVLFSIIIQAILIGLLTAVLLSFFLAKAITAPIQNLTAGTVQIARGEYSHRLQTHTNDEIGVLTRNFNSMAQVIENNLDALSSEREKLKQIFDCLEDGVAAFDEKGALLHINPSARSMLAISDDQTPDFDTFAVLCKVPDITLRLLNASNTIDIKEHKLDINGRKARTVDINFTVFFYEDTKKGYIAVLQDITERAMLEQSRREFIADVSHELRTPLTSIKGATETILSDPEMPENIENRFLNIVLNESDRMSRIVKDLLVLSRLDNQRMSWQPQSFQFYNSISQICEALMPVAAEKGHTLTLYAEQDSLPFIYADKERIEQVLTNIIGNAIKYTPNNGKIEVYARSLGSKVEINVKDNGIGIPQNDIPRLFERFYRVDKARSSEMGGTGLGLAIAKEIIDAHNGKISVASIENAGTTVTVILPVDTKIGQK